MSLISRVKRLAVRVARIGSVPARALNNLRMRSKLLAGFTVVLALAGLVAVIGLQGVSRLDGELVNLYDNALQPIRQISGANQQVIYFDRDVHAHILSSDPAAMEEIKQRIAKDDNELNGLIAQYRKTEHAAKQKERLDQFEQAWQAFKGVADEVVGLSAQSKKQEATELLSGNYRQILDYVDSSLADLARTSEDLGAAGRDAAAKTVTSSRNLVPDDGWRRGPHRPASRLRSCTQRDRRPPAGRRNGASGR